MDSEVISYHLGDLKWCERTCHHLCKQTRSAWTRETEEKPMCGNLKMKKKSPTGPHKSSTHGIVCSSAYAPLLVFMLQRSSISLLHAKFQSYGCVQKITTRMDTSSVWMPPPEVWAHVSTRDVAKRAQKHTQHRACACVCVNVHMYVSMCVKQMGGKREIREG